VLLLDQATKSWMVGRLSGVETVPLVSGLLHLTLVHNRGGAFGLLPGASGLFVLVGAAAALVILIIGRRVPGLSWAGALALGLILGGALGNLLDRVLLGTVTDFVDVRLHGQNVWPVFNLADSCITVGGVLAALQMLRGSKEEAGVEGSREQSF
jgi:signal peptidase II